MRLSPIAAAALLAVSVGVVGTARATDTEMSGPVNGPYVGGGWGRWTLKPETFATFGSDITDIAHSSDDAWKITAGYRFMPYLALEANYIDFGNTGNSFSATGSNGNYTLHAKGFEPMGVATLPLGPFEIFGKVGWLFSHNDVNIYFNQPGQQVIQTSHSPTDFVWGGGLGFTVFRHMNFNAEYDRVRVSNAPKSDVLWLMAQWRF
jgi:hypothetical protein